MLQGSRASGIELIQQADIIVQSVMAILALASIWSWTIAFDKVFKEGKILEATWDSNIVDMQRSLYIIDILKEKVNFLGNLNKQSAEFISRIESLSFFKNIRHTGYLIALDCQDSDQRNMFIQRARTNGLLLNPTGVTSIRVRPHLLTSQKTFDLAYKIISDSI